MKVQVDGNSYDVEIAGNTATVNGKKFDLKSNEEEIILDGKQYFLDFLEEGEPSLLIINGMSYLVSKSASVGVSAKELRAQISGEIVDVFVTEGSDVIKGQLLLTLEAMKMENQMKSPVKGKIREVKVKKGQLAKRGEVLLTFQ
jgi:biotin carboxyl carrier protein